MALLRKLSLVLREAYLVREKSVWLMAYSTGLSRKVLSDEL